MGYLSNSGHWCTDTKVLGILLSAARNECRGGVQLISGWFDASHMGIYRGTYPRGSGVARRMALRMDMFGMGEDGEFGETMIKERQEWTAREAESYPFHK